VASQNQALAYKRRDQVEEVVWVEPRLTAFETIVKRCLDLIIASVAVIVLSPLMLFVALAIKLESRGPAVFKQARVGKDGREFTCYKFRSMYDGADGMRDGILHLNEVSGPVFKIRDDPRVTPVGRIIRRTSIDELLQFFNVLKGDMSVVGPRPPLPCEVAEYTEYHWQRLSVIPGITCLWQISGRSNIGFDRWVELDLEYIRNQSLWHDMAIIVKTVPAVVRGTGAH